MGFWDPTPHGASGMNAPAFGSFLKSQEQTLEELFIYGNDDETSGFYLEMSIDLHSFTQLQYIGLPFAFLYVSRDRLELRSISTYVPSISEILPPFLKALQFEIPNDDKYLEYFPSTRFNEVYFKPGEMRDFICEIALKKGSRFAGLQEIVFCRQAILIQIP